MTEFDWYSHNFDANNNTISEEARYQAFIARMKSEGHICARDENGLSQAELQADDERPFHADKCKSHLNKDVGFNLYPCTCSAIEYP